MACEKNISGEVIMNEDNLKNVVLKALQGKDLTKSHTLIIKKCPICDEFTSHDEWAKPQVACINCGIGE